MNPVKVGVVGVGNMGSFHCNKLKGMKNVDFIGVHDPDFKKAHAIGEQLSVYVFSTYKDLLSKVDAVIIAAPTKFHYSLAEEGIKAGKHVFVEKPIAVSLEETSKLKELQRVKKTIVQVGHIERFNPVSIQLMKLINKNNIIFMEAKRLGLSRRIKDVDVVLDVMIHDIDIILSLAQSPIIDISAAGVCLVEKGHYDYVTALLTFKNGVIASLVASNISHEKERTLIITEKERMIKTDYLARQQVIVKNTSSDSITSKEYPTECVIDKIAIPYADPLTQELEHFVKSIKNNQRPLVGIAEGEAAIEVALKIKACLQ